MTEAAGIRGTTPTASVLAQGQRDSNLIQLAPAPTGLSAGSQSLRARNETASIHNPYLNPNHAAKAMPASMMMTSIQSVGSRSSFIQALIDIGALFFAALFVCLFGLAVAVAMFILLFVNLKF